MNDLFNELNKSFSDRIFKFNEGDGFIRIEFNYFFILIKKEDYNGREKLENTRYSVDCRVFDDTGKITFSRCLFSSCKEVENFLKSKTKEIENIDGILEKLKTEIYKFEDVKDNNLKG